MVMITGIRATLPIVEALASTVPESHPPHKSGPAPVSAPAQTAQRAQSKATTSDSQFWEGRMTTESNAAAAAEAARDAYIKASIAAGINPLPLP